LIETVDVTSLSRLSYSHARIARDMTLFPSNLRSTWRTSFCMHRKVGFHQWN